MMRGTNADVRALLPYITEGSVGIELGVWKGDTSALLLTRARHLHLVDAWSVESYRGVWDDYLARYADGRTPDEMQADYDAIYRSVGLRFMDAPVTIHRMTSAQFFARQPPEPAPSWVYIDASHEYADVYNDIHAAIDTGLAVFGDDYGGSKAGVTRAVDDFAGQYRYTVERIGSRQFTLLR